MPWQVSNPMSQRVQFVAEAADGFFTMTELCRRYGISRKTGYKWIARGGDLRDRSRRPHQLSTTAPATVARILALRRQYGWGPRKLRKLLTLAGVRPVPARSTIAGILRRAGVSVSRRRRSARPYGPAPQTAMTAPNVVWTADFKGEFRTQDGRWCYPLTVVDGFSRYLLACQGLAAPRTALTRPVFERVFRRYGLPAVLRTDNGEPFASATSLGRLSRLSVWWLRLGIQVERIAPGRPEQNGRHERFHRSLVAATLQPTVARHARAQQRRFRDYQRLYNGVRPHEALQDQTPAAVYMSSPRAFPTRLPPLEYSAAHVVRRVGPSGSFHWRGHVVHLSHVLTGEDVGLLPVGEGLWTVYFATRRLGLFDERLGRMKRAD
jgi:transposase InsO family protein